MEEINVPRPEAHGRGKFLYYPYYLDPPDRWSPLWSLLAGLPTYRVIP